MDSEGKGHGGPNVEKRSSDSDSESEEVVIEPFNLEEQYYELDRWRGISLELIDKIVADGVAVGLEGEANVDGTQEGNDGDGEMLSDEIEVLEEEGPGVDKEGADGDEHGNGDKKGADGDDGEKGGLDHKHIEGNDGEKGGSDHKHMKGDDGEKGGSGHKEGAKVNRTEACYNDNGEIEVIDGGFQVNSDVEDFEGEESGSEESDSDDEDYSEEVEGAKVDDGDEGSEYEEEDLEAELLGLKDANGPVYDVHDEVGGIGSSQRPFFMLGEPYAKKADLTHAISGYAIKEGVQLRLKKSEPYRVRAICQEGCPFDLLQEMDQT